MIDTMKNFRLVWIRDADAADHVTTDEKNISGTAKTLCGRKGWDYQNGDDSRIWNATCIKCEKAMQKVGA